MFNAWRSWRILTLLAMLTGLLLATLTPVLAYSLTITPNSGPIGTQVTASGTGYKPNVGVYVDWYLDSGNYVELGRTVADSQGSFSVSFQAPASARSGGNTISLLTDANPYLYDASVRSSHSVSFTITGTGGGAYTPGGYDPNANSGCFLGSRTSSGCLPQPNLGPPTTSGASATLTNPLGGQWIRPDNGGTFAVGDTVHFAANAYGGSGVQHVDFTILPNGQGWFTACTAYPPGGSDVFTCDWQVPNSIALGSAQATFNVYTANDHKNSPANPRYFQLVSANATTPAPSNAIKAPAPFKSQWDDAAQQGCANCGPAVIASAVGHYRKNVSTQDVSMAIRGTDWNACPGTDTDFRDVPSDFDPYWSNRKTFYNSQGLDLKDVTSLDDLKNQLDAGHPVLVLILNKYLLQTNSSGNSVPYPYADGFTVSNGTDIKHIVLVTGYDQSSIYINDPLAVKLGSNGSYVSDPDTGTNFAVPTTTFDQAAKGANGATWYGSAVVPQ